MFEGVDVRAGRCEGERGTGEIGGMADVSVRSVSNWWSSVAKLLKPQLLNLSFA
jgi:hypothetical protein